MHHRSKLYKGLGLILLCALPLFSQAQKRQKSHDISFQIDGYPNKKITIAYHQQGKHYIEDSLFTDGRGRAVWNHIEDIPRGVYLAVFPELGNIYFEFIVSGNESFDIRTSADNVVDNLAFQGSAENDVFYQDMDQMAALSKQANALNAQIQGVADAEQKKALRDQIEVLSQTIKASRAALMREHSTLFYAALLGVMQETEIPEWLSEADNRIKFQYYHDHFLDYIDFSDPGIIRTPVFHNKMMNYLDKATEQVPDSLMRAAVNIVELSRANDDVFQYVLVQVLNKYANSEIVCMDKIYVELVMRYYKTGLAYWTDSAQNAKIVERGMALAPIVCGQIAPEMCLYDHNFTFPANRLNEVCLDNIKSDYTILFIYDPDCGHCKKATPKLVDFHEKFMDYDISIYAVSTTVHDSAQVEEWHEFIESKGLEKFYNVADLFNNRGMRDNYDLSATPVVFVLDAEKRIIGKRLGVEQIEQFIRSYWSTNDRERFERAENDFGPLKDLIEELRRQREAGEDEEHFEGDGHDH